MSLMVFVAACVAGGLGAVVRFVVDGIVKSALSKSRDWAGFPLATAIINVTGSFGLGLFTGLAAASVLSHDWVMILGGGLMGGYTTCSTASVDTVRLALSGRGGPLVLAGLGALAASVAAAALGLWLGAGA